MPRKIGTAGKREMKEHLEEKAAVYWEAISIIDTDCEVIESRLLLEDEKSDVRVEENNLTIKIKL
ncbi:MAG: hypothetical protein ACOVQ4_04065 [Flectobacillus sp.]|uniref:hypothetical protein n=1 Tax=Flectobacillus sp. TaxID=50419 RepID=UPI003B99A0B2